MLTNSRDIIKRLERDGWVHDRTKGDHHVYKKIGVRDHISITHPRKDVSVGLVIKIYKVAGWPRD
jgi:predicted RNA binding protein YcfA (HicA-like mRNA interferase family)